MTQPTPAAPAAQTANEAEKRAKDPAAHAAEVIRIREHLHPATKEVLAQIIRDAYAPLLSRAAAADGLAEALRNIEGEIFLLSQPPVGSAREVWDKTEHIFIAAYAATKGGEPTTITQ